MVRQGSIDSDMVSEHRELKGRPQEELGFYLVASNRELLNHVETLMNRKGVFGVLDSSGRVHYLIDARKGSPLAARNVMATAGSVAGKVCRDARREKRRIRLVSTRCWVVMNGTSSFAAIAFWETFCAGLRPTSHFSIQSANVCTRRLPKSRVCGPIRLNVTSATCSMTWQKGNGPLAPARPTGS